MHQVKSRISLKRFFFFFLIISIIVPLVILGWMGIFVSSRILKRELSQADKRQVTIVAEKVEQYLQTPKTILNIIANQLESLENRDKDEVKRLLKIYSESFSFIHSLQVADFDGIIKYHFPEVQFLEESDISGYEYFKEINKGKEAYWSSTSMSNINNAPMSSLSIPFESGVLTAFLSLENMEEIIGSGFKNQEGIILYLTDQNGVYISHPEVDKVRLQEYDPYFLRIRQNILSEEELGTYTYNEKMYNVYNVFIKSSNWMVALYQPVDTIKTPLQTISKWLFFLTLIAAIFAFSFGNLMRRSITNPLLSLLATTNKIADGHYDIHFPHADLTELSQLSKSIEFMAKDIQIRENDQKRNRIYLSNIINSMPSALIGLNPWGIVTQWNKQIEEISGINIEDALDKKFIDLIPRFLSLMGHVDTAIIEREKQHIAKVEHMFKGELRTEDITIYPLITNGVSGVVIRIDDITEKIMMEEMIIQNDKILSVGGLAAGMAHEINNPLAGMIQTVNVMSNRLGFGKEFTANEEAAEESGITMENLMKYMERRGIVPMIEKINESGKRMASIVNNMLNFTRKKGTSVLPYKITDLIDNTLDLSLSDYNQNLKYDFKNIRILKKYEKDIPLAKCEKSKIQQVFFNILQNGAHAMIESGVKNPIFEIRTSYSVEKNLIYIEIQDNGPGIEEHIRKRIFEPFFTTKSEGLGTGLGLSVSFFIITENCKGEMSVQSQPGEGATFIVGIPPAD